MYRILQSSRSGGSRNVLRRRRAGGAGQQDAVKSKAPVVTERLSFTGRYCVLTVGKTGIGFSAKSVMPPTKPGFAGFWNVTWPELRTWALLSGPNAVTVEECAVREELAELMRTWQRLSLRAWA